MTAPIAHDRVVTLSPLVRRLTQPNGGPFTGPGTNTHLVGTDPLFVLDPGEDVEDGHLERIVAAVGGARVAAVIPSHGHSDHWTLAPRLALAVHAPIWFSTAHPRLAVDRILVDGDLIDAGGARLEVLATPGHTPDHLCFVLAAERTLFAGDMVMGWSTSIIAPPEGDLRDYLRSMRRLLALPDIGILHSGHGEAVTDPAGRIAGLIAHREERTRQAVAALEVAPSRIGGLVERIYADVDPRLHPAAAASLSAHLLALEAEGVIERSPEPEGGWEGIVWRLRR